MATEELRGKLDAVRDIKSEYYVGTQEAWNAIKEYAYVYENPIRIAREINAKAGLEGALYKATPQRLVGLSDALRILEQEHTEMLLIDVPFSWMNYGEWLFNNDKEYLEFIDTSFIFKSTSQLFAHANRDGVKDDKEFGQFFTETMMQELKDKSLDLYLMPCVALSNFNYEDLFSVENYNRVTREIGRDAMLHNLELSKSIKRIEKDKVDNRLEYRRAILSHYLQNFCDDEMDCDEIIIYLDSLIEKRKKHAAHFRDSKWPEVVIARAESLLHESIFLRRLFGSEKNWVNKFLKN